MKKLQILLVEDNPINIKFIQSLFSEYAVQADVAEDGLKAIQKLQDNQYDVVLMNIEMPNMNGYETTQIIRTDLKLEVPIFAMTDNAMTDEKEKCIAIGMNDYISKPISAELLFAKMQSVYAAKYGIAGKTGENGIPKKLINLSFLFENIGNKKTEIVEIIDIFCEQLTEDMKELSAAIAKADYENTRQYAHRMKSTLSLLAVDAMLGISKEIEAKAIKRKEIEEIRELHKSLATYFSQVLKEAQEEKNKLLVS